MLLDSGVQQKYWPEAMQMACYVRNLSLDKTAGRTRKAGPVRTPLCKGCVCLAAHAMHTFLLPSGGSWTRWHSRVCTWDQRSAAAAIVCFCLEGKLLSPRGGSQKAAATPSATQVSSSMQQQNLEQSAGTSAPADDMFYSTNESDYEEMDMFSDDEEEAEPAVAQQAAPAVAQQAAPAVAQQAAAASTSAAAPDAVTGNLGRGVTGSRDQIAAAARVME
jgi:hypothetical protein